MVRRLYATVKSSIFGPEGFHHTCSVGLSDPQPEVAVRLHGLGTPLDVTSRNVIAGFSPLTIGIGLERDLGARLPAQCRLSLKFHEAGGANRLLAEIGLRPVDTIPLGREQLSLFAVGKYKNYCSPRLQCLRSYVSRTLRRPLSLKGDNASNPKPTALESQCLYAFYICPRPVVLVSVIDGKFGSIFPMDLIGPIGNHSFSLALHRTSAGVPLIEHSRRVALSSVPMEQAAVAYALGKNHKNLSVDWQRLPFATTTSAAFDLPVPQFSLRVREMQVAAVLRTGSHALFVCDVVEDRRYSNGKQLFIIHGFYQNWRTKLQSMLRANGFLNNGYEVANGTHK
jgi:flavin reductase (DIM6/NTAB) family NADH-FMN oxidoreductase RutF